VRTLIPSEADTGLQTRTPRAPSPWLGFVVGLASVGVLTAALGPSRDHVATVTVATALLLPVIGAALLGGQYPAIGVALVAGIVLDVVFTEPYGTFRIAFVRDAVADAVFVVIALVTGTLVARESARRQTAEARANELAEMHDRLQRTIAERDRLEAETRRLAVLEEVDRQRAALLRAVSHELRTPLGTILSVASDLSAGTGYDDATRRVLLTLVTREAERLDRVVTNVLSLSRIEAGAFAPDVEPTDLRDVIHDAVNRLQGLLGPFDVVVEIAACSAMVMIDFTQIELVFANLLENAARYAPSGSKITVAATTAGEYARVEVADEGSGVARELRDTLFEPFLSGSDRTGIGLAICRAIVEAHGGTIFLDDHEPFGAHFVVELPLAS
jgi:K+-sensing histidine kinase KdpD